MEFALHQGYIVQKYTTRAFGEAIGSALVVVEQKHQYHIRMIKMRRIDSSYHNARTRESEESSDTYVPSEITGWCKDKRMMCTFVLVRSTRNENKYVGTGCSRSCPKQR